MEVGRSGGDGQGGGVGAGWGRGGRGWGASVGSLHAHKMSFYGCLSIYRKPGCFRLSDVASITGVTTQNSTCRIC